MIEWVTASPVTPVIDLPPVNGKFALCLIPLSSCKSFPLFSIELHHLFIFKKRSAPEMLAFLSPNFHWISGITKSRPVRSSHSRLGSQFLDGMDPPPSPPAFPPLFGALQHIISDHFFSSIRPFLFCFLCPPSDRRKNKSDSQGPTQTKNAMAFAVMMFCFALASIGIN